MIPAAIVGVNPDSMPLRVDLEQARQSGSRYINREEHAFALEKAMDFRIRSSVVSDQFALGVNAYNACV